MYMPNARRVFVFYALKDTFARIYMWRAIEAASVVFHPPVEALPKTGWPEAWGKMP